MTKSKSQAHEQVMKAAHKASFLNQEAISQSAEAGCFHCCKVFPTSQITKWVPERCGGKTAKCPHCEIDSVLASSSGYPLTQRLLKAMYHHWFGRSLTLWRKKIKNGKKQR